MDRVSLSFDSFVSNSGWNSVYFVDVAFILIMRYVVCLQNYTKRGIFTNFQQEC
jgi:hypothetical protein